MAASNKLVLVVEDDESVRKLVTRALSSICDVESSPDGLAAIRRMGQPPIPDLLICDIMMPGADGLAVARQLKANANTKQVPIIFLTAKSTPQDMIVGIQTGARHYLTKPFKLDDLLQKVRKLLGG